MIGFGKYFIIDYHSPKIHGKDYLAELPVGRKAEIG